MQYYKGLLDFLLASISLSLPELHSDIREVSPRAQLRDLFLVPVLAYGKATSQTDLIGSPPENTLRHRQQCQNAWQRGAISVLALHDPRALTPQSETYHTSTDIGVWTLNLFRELGNG